MSDKAQDPTIALNIAIIMDALKQCEMRLLSDEEKSKLNKSADFDHKPFDTVQELVAVDLTNIITNFPTLRERWDESKPILQAIMGGEDVAITRKSDTFIERRRKGAPVIIMRKAFLEALELDLSELSGADGHFHLLQPQHIGVDTNHGAGRYPGADTAPQGVKDSASLQSPPRASSQPTQPGVMGYPMDFSMHPPSPPATSAGEIALDGTACELSCVRDV